MDFLLLRVDKYERGCWHFVMSASIMFFSVVRRVSIRNVRLYKHFYLKFAIN
jgi:hypothetical protein